LNCSRALQRCRKIYETGNIQPMNLSGLKIGPTKDDASWNSALDDLGTPCARYRGAIAILHMSVALGKFTSRAHLKFIFYPGGALHMYLALQLFNLNLRSAL
jgi:hypothetical protein